MFAWMRSFGELQRIAQVKPASTIICPPSVSQFEPYRNSPLATNPSFAPCHARQKCVCADVNQTKMFHVKHFGPVGASFRSNLIPHASVPPHSHNAPCPDTRASFPRCLGMNDRAMDQSAEIGAELAPIIRSLGMSDKPQGAIKMRRHDPEVHNKYDRQDDPSYGRSPAYAPSFNSGGLYEPW